VCAVECSAIVAEACQGSSELAPRSVSHMWHSQVLWYKSEAEAWHYHNS
jgi:hypothetical protein